MKFNDVLKWFALAVTLTGATLTSAVIYPLNLYVMNVGAVLHIIWGIRSKTYNIALVNLGLMVIYGGGVLYSRHYLDGVSAGIQHLAQLVYTTPNL